jgi:peptidyl-prolyl cis-trans isomerase D
MAKKYSNDPGSAQRGGSLGAFHREELVKPFSDAVVALRPGQISPLVETQFGYHIIQRPTYNDAKSDFDQAYGAGSRQVAESTYIAKLDRESNISVKSNAPAVAKSAARELSAHRSDDDVLATYKGGDLTTAEFVKWVEAMPPQMRVAQQLQQAPDTVIRDFVKSVARNEVMIQKADSAKIDISAEERQRLHDEFRQLIQQLWMQLGIDPKALSDSAKSVPERERYAATKVESYLDRVMAGQAQPVPVPQPVQVVLASKYTSKVYPAGVDRAVERAQKLRSTADSTRTSSQPRSAVPLPTPRPDTTARRDSGSKK